MDSASTCASGRAGLWVVLRLSEVGLVGERGSKVPNASIGELSLEIEVALALDFEFSRCIHMTLLTPAYDTPYCSANLLQMKELKV